MSSSPRFEVQEVYEGGDFCGTDPALTLSEEFAMKSGRREPKDSDTGIEKEKEKETAKETEKTPGETKTGKRTAEIHLLCCGVDVVFDLASSPSYQEAQQRIHELGSREAIREKKACEFHLKVFEEGVRAEWNGRKELDELTNLRTWRNNYLFCFSEVYSVLPVSARYAPRAFLGGRGGGERTAKVRKRMLWIPPHVTDDFLGNEWIENEDSFTAMLSKNETLPSPILVLAERMSKAKSKGENKQLGGGKSREELEVEVEVLRGLLKAKIQKIPAAEMEKAFSFPVMVGATVFVKREGRVEPAVVKEFGEELSVQYKDGVTETVSRTLVVGVLGEGSTYT